MVRQAISVAITVTCSPTIQWEITVVFYWRGGLRERLTILRYT